MKRFLILILLLMATPAFCQVGEWIDASGTARPFSLGWPLPVQFSGGVTVTVGSSTFTFSPVFADAGGSGTLALTDSSRRIVVNLGSDTIGLLTAIASITRSVGNPMNGFLASITINVGTSAAVLTPTMAGVRKYFVTSNVDVNEGFSDVGTMTGVNWIPANCPGFQRNVATNTPQFWYRAQTASGQVYFNPCIEP